MPVINFNGADKVVLGSEADRVYLGNVLAWEAVKKRLFYDSSSGKPFDYEALDKNHKVIVIPKKDFPLDILRSDRNIYGEDPNAMVYSYAIVTTDPLMFVGTDGVEIFVIQKENEPLDLNQNIIWNLYNKAKVYAEIGKEVTNIKFIADWIDKIYIVEE